MIGSPTNSAAASYETFLTPSVLDGKTYGLPVAASARAMYYNKDIFSKAGYDAAPATWDDLKAAAAKIKETSPDVYAFGLQGKEIETDFYFNYAIWSYGGDIIQGRQIRTRQRGGHRSGQALQGLHRRWLHPAGRHLLLARRCAEPVQAGQGRQDVITAPFLSNQIKDGSAQAELWCRSQSRRVRAATAATYGVTNSIVLFKNSKNKDEAWKFLDFIFSTEMRTKFDKVEGFLPVNNEEAKDPMFADNADLKVFTALLPDARFAPVIPGWEEIARSRQRPPCRRSISEKLRLAPRSRRLPRRSTEFWRGEPGGVRRSETPGRFTGARATANACARPKIKSARIAIQFSLDRLRKQVGGLASGVSSSSGIDIDEFAG